MEHGESRLFEDRPARIAHEARLQASCFWCEQSHDSKHPLSVCPACVGTARAGRFPMGSLAMQGSYPLTAEMIDATLTRKSPGNYALGYLDGDTFLVFYVGRSDSDVRHRLHAWVGAPSGYDRHAPSTRAAWEVARRGPLSLEVATQSRVGAAMDSGYTRFAYSYAPSAEAAFAKEWRNYDDFGGSDGLDNALPPSRRQRAPEEPLEQRA
ncbi:MAG TPA: hypothetical protein VMW19_06260 [Myxococcota bacterium]|nr:hypothetical protein [Myxococcota bacterium]